MQYYLNGVHVSEVSKFLVESHTLQISDVPSYFGVYSPCIAKYQNDIISNIHLTAEESPWDPSTEEYSECETDMSDH